MHFRNLAWLALAIGVGACRTAGHEGSQVADASEIMYQTHPLRAKNKVNYIPPPQTLPKVFSEPCLYVGDLQTSDVRDMQPYDSQSWVETLKPGYVGVMVSTSQGIRDTFHPGDEVRSENGRYRLKFETGDHPFAGSLCLWDDSEAQPKLVWKTDGKGKATEFQLWSNSAFVGVNGTSEVWTAHTGSKNRSWDPKVSTYNACGVDWPLYENPFLVLSNDGNLILTTAVTMSHLQPDCNYKIYHHELWSSQKGRKTSWCPPAGWAPSF
jgi:hypothetical protein